MSVIIGVDIGTTHIKAIAYSQSGEVLHQEKAICKTIQTESDRAEQDPEAIFKSLISLLECVAVAERKEEIKGICFSAGMHSVIALNANAEPLTNAILWGDTRSISQANALKSSGKADAIYKISGVPIHPVLPLCKIMWLKENEPKLFFEAKKFISIKEYIFYKLFGKFVVDPSIAASSGMMDLRQLKWNENALNIAGIKEDQLSTIVPSTHAETELQNEYKDYFDFPSNTPFIVGSSDGCLANIGTGVWDNRKAALTIGTSGAVRTTGTSPVFQKDQQLFCYPLAEKLFVTGGPTNNGAYLLQWYSKNFMHKDLVSENDFDGFVHEAQTVPAGAEGLLFLPYLQGERAPIWDAEASGVFFGLNTLHREPHMMRALIEGISFSLYDIFNSLESVSGHISTVCASGGFVQSELWVQMLANIFNRNMMVTNISDASAIGAGLLGFYAIGTIKSWDEVKERIPAGKIFYPDPKEHEAYLKYFTVFKGLYPSLKNHFHQLRMIENKL